ncbi:MAG TPA: 2-dehydro-3-deoxyphosphogluconate aldolase [Firmicutes bacterium]|nr:2-dehydro-3-deoxyphosphogluconate aldolase [Bacillota bacterium]
MNVVKKIEEIKIVPVVVINDIEETIPLMDKLVEGGVPVAEITFRTSCAKEAIKLAINKYPDAIIGAGTVINKEQCKQAIEAGSKFIVSPGLSKEVFEICKENNIPYVPGVVTPTEIMEAISLGLDHLKFFPAGVFGGLKAIKALSAAFPSIKFMPTGGVDLSNLSEFASNKKIFAIGGSFLTKGDIVSNCQEAVKIIKESK